MNERICLSRRRLLGLAVSALAGTLLASCTPAATPTPAPAADVTTAGPTVEVTTPAEVASVTLTYWVCWPGIYAEHERENVLDLYEQVTEGKVKIQHLPVPEGIGQKLVTAVAAGEPPDVAVCFGALIPLAAKGVFLPIDEYVNASTTIDLEDLFPSAVAATIWKGVRYGFPYNCSCEMMLVNRGMCEEAGIEVAGSDNPDEWGPETWEEFTEISKKLVKEDSSGNLQVVAYTQWNVRHDTEWFCCNGANPYDPESNTLNLPTEQCAEGWGMVANYFWELYGDFARSEEFMSGTGSAAESPFCVGQRAIDFAGSAQPPRIAEWCPDVRVWPWLFPKGPQGTHKVSMGGGDYGGVLNGTKHPDEAYAFMEWMVMEGNVLWKFDPPCRMSQCGQPKSEWIELWGEKDGTLISSWWEGQLAKSCPVENFPSYTFMNDELVRVFELVLYKKVTIEEGLAEVQANVEADMAKYP